MARGRLLNVVRIVVGVLVIGAIVVALQRNWDEVVLELSRLGWGAIGVAFLLALMSPILTYFGWRELMNDLGARLPVPAGASVFLVGQLGKYLPGSVWSIAIQSDMGGRLGVSRRTLGVTGLLSIALATLTGTLVGLPTVPLLLSRADETQVSAWWVLLAVLLAAVLLWPRLLNALIARGLRLLRRDPLEHALGARALAACVAWFVAAWVSMGGAAWELARHLVPGTPGAPAVGAGTLLVTAVCGYCLAAAIGMFSVIVPAGAGVRDGVLALLLLGVLPIGAATAVVVVHRFLSVLVDVAAALAAFLWGRAHHLVGGRSDG